MTYEETVAGILDIPRFTTKNGLSHTRDLMKRLDNPQDKLPTIHVAGSNGKGSVCAFLSSILTQSGVRTGLFTSPHLVSLRERFRINGEPCTREQFLRAEGVVRRTVMQMQNEGLSHPTFFEYIFAVGMVLFAQEKVECIVLETGLGGRLDATNVVAHPLLTIITSISLEHTEILGDTIEAIAGEKAGIIKPGIPVIFDGSEPLAEPVILEAARAKGAEAEKISPDKINILLNDGKHIDFSYESRYDVTRVSIPFPAEYQAVNAALALTAAHRLKSIFPITDESIREGFRCTIWPGRMEELYPDVYLEGAHNVSGVQAFLKTVGKMTTEPSILLFSMVQGKREQEALDLLLCEGCWEELILTEISDNERALPVSVLYRYVAGQWKENIKVTAIQKPGSALRVALSHKKPGQKVFCVGSLYLIGELKKEDGGYTDD